MALEAGGPWRCPAGPSGAQARWHARGRATAGIAAAWQAGDESALVKDSLERVVQVNGKGRAKLTVPANADKDSVEALAREEANVVRFTEGKTIRKVIVVPGKLVNIVAN